MGAQPRSLRARAARVAGVWLVALVAVAVLLVAGAMAGRAGLHAGGQGVLAGSTGDIHVGSGG
jgi:hypothetical protein